MSDITFSTAVSVEWHGLKPDCIAAAGGWLTSSNPSAVVLLYRKKTAYSLSNVV